MNELVPIEDMNYLAQQSQGKINMILSGMTALMNDTEDKTEKIEKQNWFQRMIKTVTGKNRATREEIRQNHDKLNAYMSQAIAELYDRSCIDSQVMISLGTQLNELYAEHLQLKQMLGAFVVKLNEKIDSVDNFHMLNTEIEQGVYSNDEKIIAICKVMSQFDNRIMEESRKLDILKRSMEKQEIITGDEVLLKDYLMKILNTSTDEIGKIYLELSTIRNDFFASLILGIIEDYHFLPDIQRKMIRKDKLIENLIQREGLDDTITLSVNEVYDNFINSKLEVKEGLVTGETIQTQGKSQISYDNDLKIEKAEQLFLSCKFDEAFEIFEKLAENGNGRAMYFLGEFYDQSYGKIRKNKKKSEEWRIKGKEKGDVLAALNVAYSFPKNSDEGNINFFELFENVLKVSKNGDIFAQNELADMYLYGYGTKENEEEGIKWLKKSAEAGYWRTMNQLGNLFYNRGDYEKAIEWYKKSFEKGCDWGGLFLAACYQKGNGVRQDKFKALELLKEVYDLDNSASGIAAYEIGSIYSDEKNYLEAIEWYKKSFEKGCDWGGLFLAACYQKGNGVRQDKFKALELYKEVYDLDNSTSGLAASTIGNIQYGEKNYLEAIEWYKRGIEKDSSLAYYGLAECYYNGNGVLRDKDKAYELYKKAAELGDEDSKTIIANWY